MDNVDGKSHGNSFRERVRTIPRHKFLIIIPLVVVFLGSTIVGSTLPKGYKATALFRDIDPDAEKGRPRRSRGQEDLQVMKAIILSHSNLVEVIKSVGLDASYRNLPEDQQVAYEDKLVNRLRKNLEIEEKANKVFAISYRGEDPDLVHRVANEVMRKYIDGVVQKETTSLNEDAAFLEAQVKKYQEKVATSSEALKKFRVDHILELPDTQLSDIAEFSKILDSLSEAENKLSDAETTKKEIEKQIADLDPEMVGETVVKQSPLVAKYRSQLNELELKLAELKTQLKDAHPAVVDVKNQIETVKSLMEKAAQETTTEQKRQSNPLYLSLLEKVKQAEVDIVKATRTRDRLLAKKGDCEKRVRNSPVLQKELTKLMDEDKLYRTILDQYSMDLRKAQMEQAREMNRKQARFPIQDSARRPSSPERSNRLKVAFLGLIVGGGLGLGLAVLKDQMDTSFQNVEDAASFLHIPIVGTIPVIATAAEKAREKKRETWGWMVVGALVILLGAALAVVTLTSL